MKKLRILPGAAGVIALTATFGFVDGQREMESENFSRDKISQIKVMPHVAADGASSGNRIFVKPEDNAYLVKIERGDISTDVLIDATTGKILKA